MTDKKIIGHALTTNEVDLVTTNVRAIVRDVLFSKPRTQARKYWRSTELSDHDMHY
mgnify:CR=1 FL=1